MYEIDYKNTVKNYTVGIIFFVVGLILFIVFSIFAFSGPIKKASMDQETIATKVESNCRYDNEGDYMCSPIYYFEIEGKSYECQSSFSSSTIPSSDNNKFYYRSNKPSNCVKKIPISPKSDPLIITTSAEIIVGHTVNPNKDIYNHNPPL